MKTSGKPAVKSVNDKIEKGDYVLLKNFDKYDLGYNNGEFIEILREDMQLPPSPTEIELDRIATEEEARLEKLRIEEQKVIQDIDQDALKEKYQKVELWKEFKEKYSEIVPAHMTQEQFFELDESFKQVFDDFVREKESPPDFTPDYFDVDDGEY